MITNHSIHSVWGENRAGMVFWNLRWHGKTHSHGGFSNHIKVPVCFQFDRHLGDYSVPCVCIVVSGMQGTRHFWWWWTDCLGDADATFNQWRCIITVMCCREAQLRAPDADQPIEDDAARCCCCCLLLPPFMMMMMVQPHGSSSIFR